MATDDNEKLAIIAWKVEAIQDALSRIAVLETKVDELHESVIRIESKIEPIIGLYHFGKLVTWLVGGILTYLTWDNLTAIFHDIFPKH